MSAKKVFFLVPLFCLSLSCAAVYAEDTRDETAAHNDPPLYMVFHDIGWNSLHTFTHNYGLNFGGAIFGTWFMIESGVDWQWNRLAWNNDWVPRMGDPALYVGYVMPAVAPIAFYTAGKIVRNDAVLSDHLQLTGMALVQALALTFTTQSVMKMITGRASPGIVTELDHTRSDRTDDYSDEFNWFNMNFIGGWPSGHTANAFAAAAALGELYDNIWIKLGAYTYAALIGAGVSLNVHWASEVVSGALIGLAVGKTVGKSFRALANGREAGQPLMPVPYFSGNTIGVTMRF